VSRDALAWGLAGFASVTWGVTSSVVAGPGLGVVGGLLVFVGVALLIGGRDGGK
jgi:hypothetical protein